MKKFTSNKGGSAFHLMMYIMCCGCKSFYGSADKSLHGSKFKIFKILNFINSYFKT